MVDSDDDEEHFRREAMGAFAHELRTPLTSLRMVAELARRESSDSSLIFDDDLAAMLRHSIHELEGLADDLQEQARLERGKLTFAGRSAGLPAAFEAAVAMLEPRVTLAGEPPEEVTGPWDAARLARAIGGFAESANRIGDGSGTVRFRSSVQPAVVLLEFASGDAGGEAREIGADAGFAFFRARQFVLALGGSVQVTRSERFVSYTVTLPR